eukprot:363331-Chlamydomonas_euryale.AAC.7
MEVILGVAAPPLNWPLVHTCVTLHTSLRPACSLCDLRLGDASVSMYAMGLEGLSASRLRTALSRTCMHMHLSWASAPVYGMVAVRFGGMNVVAVQMFHQALSALKI